MLYKRNHGVTGFTLIELLIVVAIIGILAAIAIPNFLQAQIRAKVSRAKAEIRTLAGAVEQYRIDQNDYISGAGYTDLVNLNSWPRPDFLRVLTTPVDYLSSLPAVNPFGGFEGFGTAENAYGYNGGEYWHNGLTNWGWVPTFLPEEYIEAGYMWHCVGPIRVYSGYYNQAAGAPTPWVMPYDPTNGTISAGDIIFVQGPGQVNGWHSFN